MNITFSEIVKGMKIDRPRKVPEHMLRSNQVKHSLKGSRNDNTSKQTQDGRDGRGHDEKVYVYLAVYIKGCHTSCLYGTVTVFDYVLYFYHNSTFKTEIE